MYNMSLQLNDAYKYVCIMGRRPCIANKPIVIVIDHLSMNSYFSSTTAMASNFRVNPLYKNMGMMFVFGFIIESIQINTSVVSANNKTKLHYKT